MILIYYYIYDDVSNILADSGHTYTYSSDSWEDILVLYDGQAIAYDPSGNPLSYYNGTRWTFTWENGRSLATATDGTTNISYAYDASGLRTAKTVGSVTHNYLYASGQLLRETYGGNTLDFFYDASGYPYALKYNGTAYYYITNLQGDVMYLVDAQGNTVASYEYDPYGNIASATGSMAEINPLRYRGYYYDTELEMYYLQSRYYDPQIGRFINADVLVANLGGAALDVNLFAYCSNNPANMVDSTGYWPFPIVKRAVQAILSAVERALTVKYDVPLYDQGGYNLCWAYCQTMVEDYQAGVTKTPAEAFERAKELSIQQNGEKNWNSGGWPTNCVAYNVFGAPTSATGIDSLSNLYIQLCRSGPLYAYYHNGKQGNEAGAHLVVVTGVNLYSGMGKRQKSGNRH